MERQLSQVVPWNVESLQLRWPIEWTTQNCVFLFNRSCLGALFHWKQLIIITWTIFHLSSDGLLVQAGVAPLIKVTHLMFVQCKKKLYGRFSWFFQYLCCLPFSLWSKHLENAHRLLLTGNYWFINLVSFFWDNCHWTAVNSLCTWRQSQPKLYVETISITGEKILTAYHAYMTFTDNQYTRI